VGSDGGTSAASMARALSDPQETVAVPAGSPSMSRHSRRDLTSPFEDPNHHPVIALDAAPPCGDAERDRPRADRIEPDVSAPEEVNRSNLVPRGCPPLCRKIRRGFFPFAFPLKRPAAAFGFPERCRTLRHRSPKPAIHGPGAQKADSQARFVGPIIGPLGHSSAQTLPNRAERSPTPERRNPALERDFGEAAEGIRTLDLLHGKQQVPPPSDAITFVLDIDSYVDRLISPARLIRLSGLIHHRFQESLRVLPHR
jgi:hypothetical protein